MGFLMDNNVSLTIVKEYLTSIGKWDEFEKQLNSTGNVTLVTGLWNLGRSRLTGWAQRDFELYKQNFFKLLHADIPMFIYAPSSLHEEIWNIRSKHNTHIYTKEVSQFKEWFPFFETHEAIRTNPDWYNKASWLKDSPQAKLPFYNPMMMSKMFMVNDAAIINPFKTDYFYWIDGGLTSTVSTELLTNPHIYDNISKVYHDKIVHIAYPYEPSNEIHGYDKNNFYRECGLQPNEKQVYISRGGFWGGPIELIHQYNEVYYELLKRTLVRGDMGADECLFTIAAYKHPELIERFVIDSNGLVYPFFEKIQHINSFIQEKISKKLLTHSNAKVNLYVLGFNSPNQFQTVVESIKRADVHMFNKTRKILINNSTDASTFDQYDELCEQYGFEEIHQDNLGVCGGRQFVAEHFEHSDGDFYLFFEDDMFLNNQEHSTSTCRNGFVTYVSDIYNKLLKIMLKHKFDFIKLSFSEFYGENSVQWAWYNVSQQLRTELWPDYDKLPEHGIDLNSPRTKFDNIFTMDGTAYITGEVYYSNWPQIVSREGNRKMFLNTTWEYPYEQTWMSHIYQLTIDKEISAGILLASPITHNRFDHYERDLRKES